MTITPICDRGVPAEPVSTMCMVKSMQLKHVMLGNDDGNGL